MSVQRPVDLREAVRIPVNPALAYYSPASLKPETPALNPLSALDEMYAYFGSDRA